MGTSLRSVSLILMLAGSVVACSSIPSNDGVTSRQRIVRYSKDLHEHGSRVPNTRVCRPGGPHEATCFIRVVTDEAGNVVVADNLAGARGLQPSDLVSAYNIPPVLNPNATIAIVDPLDYPLAESDVNTYRTNFGLPECTSASGCFRRVGPDGSQNFPARVDTGWQTEAAADLEMASAACPNCKLLLVEANSPSSADLFAAVNTAANLGATVVSLSWGEYGAPASFETALTHPGIAIFASSGDCGFDADGCFAQGAGQNYPASSPQVTAVGGTRLVPNGFSARGWTEAAWSNAGSGCSSNTKPPWQHDTGCNGRTVADVSAVADPDTGVAVFSSAAGGWITPGGTSVAAPLVAGIYAVTGNGSMTGQYSYANPSFFNDVTLDSDGTCSPQYLCTAGPGYDGPTGNGTPNGMVMAGPTIFSIMPSSGMGSGNTSVTITGARFDTRGGTQFWFGNILATNVQCTSPSTCIVTSPAAEYPQLTATVDVTVTVAGKTSFIVPQDKFTYIGSGPNCPSSYWTCNGSETMAVFVCDEPSNVPFGGAGWQLLRNEGSVNNPMYSPVTTSVFWDNNPSDAAFVEELNPPASGTTTQYEVCQNNPFTGQLSCTPSITLTGTTACTCQAETCAAIGVTCGEFTNECGQTVDCGGCPTGQVCRAGTCGPRQCGPGCQGGRN